MNMVATAAPNALLLVPQSIEQLERVAKLISSSDLAPKDYKGKPENVAVAVAMGMELGVSPMQAIQGIAVLNGRPCVWGDLLLALCRSHPACEWIDETLEYAPGVVVPPESATAVSQNRFMAVQVAVRDAADMLGRTAAQRCAAVSVACDRFLDGRSASSAIAAGLHLLRRGHQ